MLDPNCRPRRHPRPRRPTSPAGAHPGARRRRQGQRRRPRLPRPGVGRPRRPRGVLDRGPCVVLLTDGAASGHGRRPTADRRGAGPAGRRSSTRSAPATRSAARSWPAGSSAEPGRAELADAAALREAVALAVEVAVRDLPATPAPTRRVAPSSPGRRPDADRLGLPRHAARAPPPPSARLRCPPARGDRARSRRGRAPAFPNQSLGNRGADVRAIQGLLPRPRLPGRRRRDLRGDDRGRGQGVPGRERPDRQRDRRTTTWEKLIVGLGRASTGEAVKVVQRQLNEKRRAGLAVDGVYGTADRSAVIAFQQHIGLTQHGNVGPATWRRLLCALRLPVVHRPTLCDYSVGNGAANWGTGAAIGQLEAAATAFARSEQVASRSATSASSTAATSRCHPTHEVGLDVDIRLDPRRREPVRMGHELAASSYDRARHAGARSRRSGPPRRATSSSSTSTTRS